ncbi:MAG: LCP family protein [Patescibacteria group bacterium]
MSKDKNKTEAEVPKQSRFKKYMTKRNLVIGGLSLLLIVQYLRIESAFGTFSFLSSKDSSLITEIGQIKESYTLVSKDLGEVRDFLRMPKSDYANFGQIEEDDGEAENADKNKDELQLALFSYVDYLASNKVTEDTLAKNINYITALKGENFAAYLGQVGLSLSDQFEDDSSILVKILGPGKETLVTYYIAKEDGKLWQKTMDKDIEIKSETSEKFVAEAQSFLSNNKDSLLKSARAINSKQKQIGDAINAAIIDESVIKLGINLKTEFVQKDGKISYSVMNKTDELVGEIVLDSKTLEINLVDKSNDKVAVKTNDIGKGLVPFLQKLNTKTFIEKKVDQALADMQRTIKDDGFKLLLSENGLKVAEKYREDEDRYYFDLLNKDGQALNSIVIEKTTGVINIVNPDGTNAQNLLFFEPEAKKKTLEIPDDIPEYGDEVVNGDNDFNILIAGKHGSLIDTMIFAHIDEDRGDIKMISVPRDLHYNGRKINAYAHFYGMPELKKVLSDLTGYELDKYILIDMYAFIDVIDLLGGVDVHLDKAVVDPTYVTIDNGKQGTLHYEPGDYHLGGKEALRLARTRHTSSDFARAERQQMIIEALQTKARNFGFGDADTIYEMAKTVLNQTETDISLDEAILYYFRYQNYDIKSNDVMSSGNVLYVPPYITTENCQKLVEEAKAAKKPAPGCENENHAYTLLPRDNNWNVIKWFFREKFEGTGKS